MSGTVVIVIAALFGWFGISAAVALLLGRRLSRDAPAVIPGWVRPISLSSARRRDRRPAA